MTAPTDTATDPTGGQQPVSTMETLRRVRAGRPTATRRKTTTRKAPAPAKRATSSRAESAAKRGKYADRIVGGIKSGAAVLYTRKPLQAQILMDTAEEWGAALDRVAAEDKRVDAFLAKVSGWFGKSSAWGDLGAVAAKTGAALAMSAGMLPAGPAGVAVAFLGGALVEQGVRSIAAEEAGKYLISQGLDPDDPAQHLVFTQVKDDIARQMLDQIRERARPVDDPTPTTAVPDPGGAEQWPAA